MAKASEKQIGYIRLLLKEAGRANERYLGGWAKQYGLSMRERAGLIESMDSITASKLIDGLKAQVGE
jgi:hypothetical protein